MNELKQIPACSKPLLYSRLFKFRAWNENIKRMSKPFTFGQALNFNDQIIKSLSKDEIIMQFTEVQDKNGINIYEGDVIIFEDKTKYVIIFKFGAFGFTNDFMCFIGLCESNLNILQVIGNINENSELL